MTPEDRAKLEKAQEAWDQGVFYGSQPIHMDGGCEYLSVDERQPDKVKKD